MFVPNLKILGPVVPEKSLTEKKFTLTAKAKPIYPLYTSYTGGITMDNVRGDFSGLPHSTTPAAVIANKI